MIHAKEAASITKLNNPGIDTDDMERLLSIYFEGCVKSSKIAKCYLFLHTITKTPSPKDIAKFVDKLLKSGYKVTIHNKGYELEVDWSHVKDI